MGDDLRNDPEAVADRLHSAALHLLRRLRREDEAAGLSVARLSALSVIVHAGPVALGELAAAEQVRPPTMTRIVDGLEGLGLVAREGDARDARVVRVRATEEGRALLAAARERRVARLAAVLARLEPAEREALGRAADRLGALVEEL